MRREKKQKKFPQKFYVKNSIFRGGGRGNCFSPPALNIYIYIFIYRDEDPTFLFLDPDQVGRHKF